MDQKIKNRSTDQKLDQQIKNLINRLKVESRDQKYNQQIQKFDQQIKTLINR